jgi:hypothetical protein
MFRRIENTIKEFLQILFGVMVISFVLLELVDKQPPRNKDGK